MMFKIAPLVIGAGLLLSSPAMAEECRKATQGWNFVAIKLGGKITPVTGGDLLVEWNRGMPPTRRISSTICTIGNKNHYAFYRFPERSDRQLFTRWLRGDVTKAWARLGVKLTVVEGGR